MSDLISQLIVEIEGRDDKLAGARAGELAGSQKTLIGQTGTRFVLQMATFQSPARAGLRFPFIVQETGRKPAKLEIEVQVLVKGPFFPRVVKLQSCGASNAGLRVGEASRPTGVGRSPERVSASSSRRGDHFRRVVQSEPSAL